MPPFAMSLNYRTFEYSNVIIPPLTETTITTFYVYLLQLMTNYNSLIRSSQEITTLHLVQHTRIFVTHIVDI